MKNIKKNKKVLYGIVFLSLLGAGLPGCGSNGRSVRVPPDIRPIPPCDGHLRVKYPVGAMGSIETHSVCLRQSGNNYLADSTIDLPAVTPQEIDVDVDLPKAITAQWAFDFLPMIEVDGKYPRQSINYEGTMAEADNQGRTYSVKIPNADDLISDDSETGVLSIAFNSDEMLGQIGEIQARFEKPEAP
jgi:hypothetical protein